MCVCDSSEIETFKRKNMLLLFYFVFNVLVLIKPFGKNYIGKYKIVVDMHLHA